MTAARTGSAAALGALASAALLSVNFVLPVDRTVTASRAVDGDTIVLQPISDAQELAYADRGPERVRLLCVAAPEKNEPGGPEATAWLAAQVPAGAQIEVIPGPDVRDSFGRLLAQVYVGGRNIGLEAVRAGVSRIHRSYPCPALSEFEAAEAEAKAARRGIWR